MNDERLVSIVIPVWRDEDALRRNLRGLRVPPGVEVIVSCTFDDELKYQSLRQSYPTIQWTSTARGRAIQMNAGARLARGSWILFLHADSELPTDWLGAIEEAEARPEIVGGAFRLRIDSADWRARLIEAGVRLRVALLDLPYGDQALFVRKHVFKAIGGYRDLPMMEDVDFVRRLGRVGPLLHSHSAVLTSARRWQRDGWLRRTAQNATLTSRFLLGASAARLAQRYFGRSTRAVVMMARAPWTAGKTRLFPNVGDAEHAALRHAMFFDTLDVLRSIRDVDHIIACEPPEACEKLRELAGPGVDVIAQRDGDIGRRMASCFEDTFRLGSESVVLVGSDVPDLPARVIQRAFTALRRRTNRVVLGPAVDGGYYLIGMNGPHIGIFDRIDWSSNRVLAQTLDAAKRLGLDVVLLEPRVDADDADALSVMLSKSENAGAPRTRAWSHQLSSVDHTATGRAR
jgi:rSAM/selenodomain-associated transferase 2/rSAM/selenodomain-associated transferase 1